MQPLAIAQARFDGVREGVAEIEDGAQPVVALVLGDDFGLDFAAAPDGIGQCRRIARHQRVDMGFDPVEKSHVVNWPVFDHLGQAGTEFARRQGAQGRQVAQHELRLIERADHVLAQRVVDGRLAAHGRIDLRQQRGRHLYERNTAHVAGRCETRHVAHHAAAKRKQHRLAVAAVLEQRIENQVERVPVLMDFSIGQGQQMHGTKPARQGALQGFGIKRRNGRVADDQCRRGLRQRGPQGGRGQQVVADLDRITALTERNVDALDGLGGNGLKHAAV